ncbi:MAG TPA: sulfotransferase domain-containing protein [Rhizomicrobium sp.]
MQFYALVATHHKTGSVWMRTVFSEIASALDIPFINISKQRTLDADRLPASAIVFNDHSDFSRCPFILDHPRSRIMHIIRDPRDVIISAMHYHRKAKEVWLHQPRKGLRGDTYQEKLNRFQNDRERYQFEIGRTSGRVIRDMQAWNYSRSNALECKYEDLIADTGMERISGILAHFGFEAKEYETCREIFWANSLFGALQGSQSGHIRSGAQRQWPKTFDASLAAYFLERFPDALIQLGYEPDNSWVASLGQHPQLDAEEKIEA